MMSLDRMEFHCKELIDAGFGYMTPHISVVELAVLVARFKVLERQLGNGSATEQEQKKMGKMSFQEAKAELIENAVGSHEYEDISTWDEIAEAAALEGTYASDKASRLQSLMVMATKESEVEG